MIHRKHLRWNQFPPPLEKTENISDLTWGGKRLFHKVEKTVVKNAFTIISITNQSRGIMDREEECSLKEAGTTCRMFYLAIKQRYTIIRT